MRINWILAFAIFCFSQVFSQTSISSTEWEYQQIRASLVERENRVKALITEVLTKIDAITQDLSTNTKLTALLTTNLAKLKTRLTNFGTVSSYRDVNETLDCNELVQKISNFTYDNQKCVKTKVDNDVNCTWLLVDIGNLNIAFVSNFFNYKNDTQKQSVQSLITSSMILVNEFVQYSVTLAMAIYKYTRLYIDIVVYKKNYCNCPTQLFVNTTATFVTIDSNLKQLQINIDTRETNIKKKSIDVINNITAINSDLKKSSSFVSVTTTLDSILTLVKGFQVLTTTDAVNLTATCDDAAKKVAFIQYKFELYFQINVEAARNSTSVLKDLTLLNVYTAASSQQLSSAQKTSIKSVQSSVTSLIDDFTQYILTLSTSLVKFNLELINAKTARSGSCSCKETSSKSKK
jgi:hypothetical protein